MELLMKQGSQLGPKDHAEAIGIFRAQVIGPLLTSAASALAPLPPAAAAAVAPPPNSQPLSTNFASVAASLNTSTSR